MTLSLFYAKLIGIYTLIVACFLLLRRKQIETVVAELFASKGLLYLAGMFGLLFGLIIAITHNIWEWNWRGLITLLGYLAILKGVVRMGFQEWSRKWEPRMMKGYWIIFAITALIGIYLTYSGFTQ
jgi:hypothetical protein